MPWIATSATTGMLELEQATLFNDVAKDLQAARAHKLQNAIGDDAYSRSLHTTRWFDFGKVTVIYKVVEALSMQGSGCTWRVPYTSHAGTILWLKTNFLTGQRRHRVCDEFTTYPDEIIFPKRRRRSQACSAE